MEVGARVGLDRLGRGLLGWGVPAGSVLGDVDCHGLMRVAQVVREVGIEPFTDRAAAKKRLVCLESKADRAAVSLRAVADELTRQTDTTRIISGTSYGFTVATPTDDLQQIEVPSREEIVALLHELHLTRAEIATHDWRLHDLGIS